MGSNFKVGIIAMWVVVPGLKLDEESIGDGLKSQKRLLWPSRPLVLRMIFGYFKKEDDLTNFDRLF